jgi:hypothetical protein
LVLALEVASQEVVAWGEEQVLEQVLAAVASLAALVLDLYQFSH